MENYSKEYFEKFTNMVALPLISEVDAHLLIVNGTQYILLPCSTPKSKRLKIFILVSYTEAFVIQYVLDSSSLL